MGAAYFLRFFLDADNYDKNTFFVDKTVLDVYQSEMSKEKFFKRSDFYLLTVDNGASGEAIANRLADAKANGIMSVIDQHAPIVDLNVKATNNMIKKLGK